MKRFFLFLSIFMTAFGLSACEKTMESSIVVGKNNDLLLEAAFGNGGVKKSVAQMLKIPERMTLSVTDPKGDVSADVDADILLPDTDSIPVVRVHSRDFTQEEADRIITYFIGDAAFHDRYEGYRYEEKKLMQWIDELAKEKDPDQRKSIQQSIDKYRSAGIEVPDKPHEILPSSRVFEQTEHGTTQIAGYAKDGEKHKYLRISNKLAENKNMLLYTCEQRGYADSGQEGIYFPEASKGVLKKLGFDDAEQVLLSISSEDAEKIAVEALRALNISDMKLYSCQEVWGGTFLQGDIHKQQEHHAYQLEFVRSI